MNTAIVSPSGTSAGIGFAIPVDTVNLGGTGADPQRPGAHSGNRDHCGKRGGRDPIGGRGCHHRATVPGSPAARAGLRGVDTVRGQIGDVITGVDGKPVHQLSDLTQELEQAGIGKTVQIEISRGDSKMTVSLQVADVSQPRG